ncbi:YfhO family protein [Luteimonas changyuni]|uniref:YfhO family protein n=1 Tax=Luteimonas sp. MJ145 TaxID=3129234 RepID=UPI0031BB0529
MSGVAAGKVGMHSGQAEVSDRRRRRLRLAGWALAYLVIVALLLGANPLRGETVGPFDLLGSYAGWQTGTEDVQVRHGARSDVLDAQLPNWLEARRQLRRGELPLWNPLVAGGNAQILNPANAHLTIGFAAFAASSDPAIGFYLCMLLTLAWGGLGMHLLVGRHCDRYAALFAGFSFIACGFMTAWLYWPHTHTAVWIPWLLLAVDRYMATGTTRALVGIAVATAMMFLGGFPFVVAIGLGAALVHSVAMLPSQTTGRRIGRMLAVPGGLALGLTLVAIPIFTLASQLQAIDLGGRSYGSSLTLAKHGRLLGLPWGRDNLDVETSMYVGILALPLAVLGLITLVRRRRNPIAITGAICLATGGMLVFGLLPREIGGHLPVLSNNLWTRAILLLDLGIILLAAVALDRILRRVRWRGLAVAVGIAACLGQAWDLGERFRRYNGPVPAHLFYPHSPQIEAVRQAAGPFEYVAQDSRLFLISGTLGAVGLGEWYAHALRSPALQAVLAGMADEPFTSPTATAISASGFRLDGELADITGLCYALFPTGSDGRVKILEEVQGSPAALAPINGTEVVQPFTLGADAIVAAVQVRLATYHARDLDGTIEGTLRTGGQVVSRVEKPAADVVDNAMASFLFGPVTLAAGSHEFAMVYHPGPRNRRLTAWRLQDAPGHVRVGDREFPGSLTYTVLGPPDGSTEVLAEGRTVVALRNSGCLSGPYWTSDLGNILDSLEGGKARLVDYRPSRFRVDVESTRAGHLVVPMQYQRGWEASVDGERVAFQLVDGVMPAVAVPVGRTEVEFRYVPPRLWAGLAVTFFGIGILSVLLARRQRVKPDTPVE